MQRMRSLPAPKVRRSRLSTQSGHSPARLSAVMPDLDGTYRVLSRRCRPGAPPSTVIIEAQRPCAAGYASFAGFLEPTLAWLTTATVRPLLLVPQRQCYSCVAVGATILTAQRGGSGCPKALVSGLRCIAGRSKNCAKGENATTLCTRRSTPRHIG
jgi:hypothetical protein